MIFRIYTEDKNREDIVAEVAARFRGFTILDATGVWEGTRERSIVVEIIAPEVEREDVRDIARHIKRFNAQQAVLVTEAPIRSELI